MKIIIAVLLKLSQFSLIKILLTTMAVAKTHSILLSASNTNLPIPKPKGTVIPGALNFNQASMKLIAHTNPIHRKEEMRDIGFLTTNISCLV